MWNNFAGSVVVSLVIGLGTWWVSSSLDKVGSAIKEKGATNQAPAAAQAASGGTGSTPWDKLLKVADTFDANGKMLTEQVKQNSDAAKALRDAVGELKDGVKGVKEAVSKLP